MTHNGCGNYIRRQSLEQWDLGRDFDHTIQIACIGPGDTHSTQYTCIILSEEFAEEIDMRTFDILFGVEPVHYASNEMTCSTNNAQILQAAADVLQNKEEGFDLQPQVIIVKYGIVAIAGMFLVLTCMIRART